MLLFGIPFWVKSHNKVIQLIDNLYIVMTSFISQIEVEKVFQHSPPYS